jgi:hypothetical protein
MKEDQPQETERQLRQKLYDRQYTLRGYNEVCKPGELLKRNPNLFRVGYRVKYKP